MLHTRQVAERCCFSPFLQPPPPPAVPVAPPPTHSTSINSNTVLCLQQDHYQLRVDMWDFSGNRVYASYSTFRVAGERDKYQLTVTGYSGSAQDSLYRHNRMSFSTPDSDNDGRREAHCAAEWEAGWWFNNCWFALLNGAYHNRSDVDYRGIAWNHWKREQLRKTEMKMRPLVKPGKD